MLSSSSSDSRSLQEAFVVTVFSNKAGKCNVNDNDDDDDHFTLAATVAIIYYCVKDR